MNYVNDSIGNRNRQLPAGNSMHQPTAPSRTFKQIKETANISVCDSVWESHILVGCSQMFNLLTSSARKMLRQTALTNVGGETEEDAMH